ncbi:hypothetical protein BaRGS_00017172 [Batillaria attramentaria]|uniref:C-type lectin domain-containing protein n=1 Tax=Batillaria attramentaria TaxID=370345 RepID=A0ABD0KWI3_9CAEN
MKGKNVSSFLQVSDWPVVMLFCILLSVITASFAASSGCEQDWKQFSNYCYYFSNIKTTWNKSRTACKSMGADLMVIRGEEDQRFLDRSLY